MTARDDELWIRRFHTARESAVSLVCLPHAGGSAGSYFSLSQELAPSVEMLAVQYPGRQDRRWEPPARSVEELAAGVAGALGARDRPVVLFGHSMGGAVAFELARVLEESGGAAPIALVVSARRAPSLPRPGPEEPRPASDEEIKSSMRRLEGTDARLLEDPELLRFFLPALRADYMVAGSYRGPADGQVACPITALVGDADPETTVDDAGAWRRHTTGAFDMHVYPGGHFFIDSNLPAVVEILSEACGS